MENTSREMILCGTCKGLGRVEVRVNAYESASEKCSHCEGCGRLLKTTTVKLTPFITT